MMNELRTIDELTRDELIELKRAHLCATQRQISLFDLQNRADELVSDEVIFAFYEKHLFADDDFFCNEYKKLMKGA